jgi:allophanate hydrolase
MLPTTVEHPTLEAVLADPLDVNAELGRFTNFANLLDLAALATPAGIVDGLPFGVQLVGAAFSDGLLAELARRVR